MNKFLINTSAAAIALSFFTLLATPINAASAPGTKPVLKITGESKFSGHFFQNNNRNPKMGIKDRGEKSNKTHFGVEDTRINLQMVGRADWFGQIKYDWLVGLTGDNDKETIVENRLRVKGHWGTFLIGDHYGVENFMARGAFAVMGGTGGFDGNWHDVVNTPTGVLFTTDLVGTTKYATKATYLTPRVGGLQAGFSYAPNSEHRANGKPHNQTSIKKPPEAFDVNSWAGGINFEHEFANTMQIALSATGILASTKSPQSRRNKIADTIYNSYETTNRKDTASYALGGIAEYRGFELGAEWIDNGRSRQPSSSIVAPGGTPISGFNAGRAYSFATGYTYGLHKVALGYYHSERKFSGPKSKANVYSVTYDRQLAPGLSLYGEANQFDLKTSKAAVNTQQAIYDGAPSGSKPAAPTTNNKGHAVVIGGKFRF
jgi:outer membrane protein OmpU